MKDTKYSGQLLYHYTSDRGLLGILDSRCIYATAIQDLADETELVYGKDLVALRFEQEARKNPALMAKLMRCAKCTRMLPNISELIRECGDEPNCDDAKFEWYIACFSENRDALPLWRGFTDQCMGYALGLRYRRSEDLVHYAPKRMVYYPTTQRSLVRETVAAAIKKLDDPVDRYSWMIPLEVCLYMKAPLFSSEQEWRVIWTQTDRCHLPKGEFAPKGRRPNRRAVHHVTLPLSDWDLVEIICGPRAQMSPRSRKIREGIKAFGCQPDDVKVVQSACRLWR